MWVMTDTAVHHERLSQVSREAQILVKVHKQHFEPEQVHN